jgi:hypothetical protein
MSSPKKSGIDVTRLNRVTHNNAPIAAVYRNLSVDHIGHVEPTLADNAHCVWEEGNGNVFLGSAQAAGANAANSPGQMSIAGF